ncbi:trypsin-like serine protease [Oerskovia sp. NPDC057915]|uniref:trypsin-like serine protease n=1 Tax=Oerskovia sp. NPDC057915 TaxID=3346280 RepID=UPI0036DF45F5
MTEIHLTKALPLKEDRDRHGQTNETKRDRRWHRLSSQLASPNRLRGRDDNHPPAAEVSTDDDQVTLIDNLGNATILNDGVAARSSFSADEPRDGTGNLSQLGGDAVLNPELPDEFLKALDPATGEPFDFSSVSPSDTQVSPFSVIGGDGRYAVDPGANPYNRIVFITYALKGEPYVCTGSLVANRILATAAHCLNDGLGTSSTDNGTWGTNYKVWFGYTGVGSVATCGSNVTAAPNGFTNGGGNSNWDWGLLVLNCNAGNVFGSFRPVVQTDIPLYTCEITGLPGDKADQQGYWSMFSMAGPINGMTDYRWTYSMDTAGGQSGGPVWGDNNPGCPGFCAIGIHTTGNVIFNAGSRITQNVVNAFDAYKTAYP